mgnify:FL=1|jgi:iron complex transport system ATP-binding protein
MKTLTINNLNFNYVNKEVLKDINLQFQEKKVIGIMGMNGCGKSTLLKNIINFLHPATGEIIFKTDSLEKNIINLSPNERAKIFGFIPQKSQLVDGFSVEEVITMGKVSQLKNMWKGFSNQDYDDINKQLARFKIEKFKYIDINKLSGGEQQRVFLARALVNNPDILLLDEPTSALDIHYSIEIMDIIKKIVKENSLICLIVIHDLNLASLFCDEIVFMKEGKVIYHDSTIALFKENIFEEIYNFKCEILEKNNIKYVIPKK